MENQHKILLPCFLHAIHFCNDERCKNPPKDDLIAISSLSLEDKPKSPRKIPTFCRDPTEHFEQLTLGDGKKYHSKCTDPKCTDPLIEDWQGFWCHLRQNGFHIYN